ncbi:MAG: hypothetical protein QOF76_588 [Solirubrobacteraceae bacterium]|jgi:nucleotide-binding universal stress UspA family protein|nr:hypothetical protein [Solirubrobacteraceae bacterium]
MILVCYDGSADAQAAIDHVVELMPSADVTVLTVWEPFLDAMARSGAMGWGAGMGAATAYEDSEAIDDANERRALATATEGAERVAPTVPKARPRAAARDGAVGHTILAVAEELSADLIVLGTRGQGGLKSFLLGSVSHAVVEHADRAVMVVPSPEIAARRQRQIAHEAITA